MLHDIKSRRIDENKQHYVWSTMKSQCLERKFMNELPDRQV